MDTAVVSSLTERQRVMLTYYWLFRRICGRENESDVAFGARHVARIAGSGGRPARELRAERR